MTLRRVHARKIVLPLVLLLVFPQGLLAQQDKVAALKQSLAANARLQMQYRWIETTVISMKGEEKSRIQKQCFYGPDGKIQKQQLTAPPPEEPAPGGLKGKIAAKKKAEITTAISSTNTNITQADIRVTEERVGVNNFVLEVSDLTQLQATMRAIQKVDGVVGVARVKSF